MKKFSILKKLQLYMLGFGIAMGIIFPLYANFFVEWKEGMLVFFVIGCLLAGLTVGLVSFWFVKIILLKKLKEVSIVASDIKKKNLHTLVNIESNDDIGIIVNGINNSIINIRELFYKMDKLFIVSEQALSSVKTKSDENSALQKINRAIFCVTENTKEIEKHFSLIDDSVLLGSKITNSTIEQQKETINKVSKFSNIINSLVSHSEKIADIIKIIKEIASQTNILSLNAYIEAASAEKAGKGFAVVAHEIRKLANNTNKSSQDISQTIKLIQNAVAEADKQAKIINSEVNQNSKDVVSINSQFSIINKTIRSSNNNNQKLSNSVTQLNDLFNNVQNVFNNLNKNLTQLQSIVKSYNY